MTPMVWSGLPDSSMEVILQSCNNNVIVGIDEVGRGAIAGPVTAAAVIYVHNGFPDGINDSKKLSIAKREKLHRAILDCTHVSIAHVDAMEIDCINILQAALKAMRIACQNLTIFPDHVLIDGNRIPADLPCNATPVVKGDRRSVTIAAASIVAKVERDRIMSNLAQVHPEYGWQMNRGYGTKKHLLALDAHGPTPFHRRTFAPVRNLLHSFPDGNPIS